MRLSTRSVAFLLLTVIKLNSFILLDACQASLGNRGESLLNLGMCVCVCDCKCGYIYPFLNMHVFIYVLIHTLTHHYCSALMNFIKPPPQYL